MNPDHQPLQISELVASIQSLTEAAQSKAALLAEQGRKLIALAKEALAASVQRWHDAGVCLQALDRPGMPQALGFETYYALCHKELNLAPTSVRTLVRVSKAFSAEQCSTLGVDRAEALLTLANVTQGGAVAKVLAGTPIELWSGGPQLQVASASVTDLHARLLARGARVPVSPGSRSAWFCPWGSLRREQSARHSDQSSARDPCSRGPRKPRASAHSKPAMNTITKSATVSMMPRAIR